MERVTGIGGIFFKARDPKALRAWYRDMLGIGGDDESAMFKWKDDEGVENAPAPRGEGMTIWSTFPTTTTYFAPSEASFMVNFRVRDLDAMLAQLRAAGADVDPKVDEAPWGRFGWVMDPEGNRIELWQPLG